ncbi:Pyrophosphate-energized vacuolar membrane proton pump [Diplonema papillatum]|nr:Pyrophosphate-energized vacuolar membrane proton pump [Diplonema papillatum]
MLSDAATTFLCVGFPLLGFLWALYNQRQIARITIGDGHRDCEYARLRRVNLNADDMDKLYRTSEKVRIGAGAFLREEYKVIGAFSVLAAGIIYFLIGMSGGPNSWTNAKFSVIAFIVGALASCVSGAIGMMIAVFTNSRTAHEAAVFDTQREKYENSFATAFRGGIVMGFALTSIGLLSLFVMICVFGHFLGYEDKVRLYECVAAFGLGGSTVACFGRVGGGIFTKAADVGSDLCGKVVAGLPEDDPRNPGVIADCIGDNVGDIAGMGSDLFGSFGEATCAALVVSAYASTDLTSNFGAMMFPLLITGTGILVCFLTSLCVTSGWPTPVTGPHNVEHVLKLQLLISTVLATIAMFMLAEIVLPNTFQVAKLIADSDGNYLQTTVHSWEAAFCVVMGLWAGLVIGYTTEYYTSNDKPPVQEIAFACTSGGAATNVISGLAVGYMSVVIPNFVMALTIYVAFNMCLMYGIALAALGILSTMAIGLTIDAYGPIADNAGGFVEMCLHDNSVRSVTDTLDAAGNTTAAIGKGFAIASAAFVSIALYGAFITHCGVGVVNIVDSRVFPGLLIGAMLPYWFSGWTMRSVNVAAMEMVREIQRQFHDDEIMKGNKEPDYNACVAVATRASLSEMVHSGLLVMLAPIVCGILFGKEALCGLLPGAMVSGVQMAMSMSNTGGAWDNAKKFVECGKMVTDGRGRLESNPDFDYSTSHVVKKSWQEGEEGYEKYAARDKEIHSAAVIGDTVGDPMKDTSGPALNILIKLMAIISVVFVPVINSPYGGLLFDNWWKDFLQCASLPDNLCV